MLLCCLLCFIAVIVSIYLFVLLRLIGSYIGGRLTGYTLQEITFLEKYYRKENGKLTLVKGEKRNVIGSCGMVPPEREDGKIPIWLHLFMGSVLVCVVAVALPVLCTVFKPHYLIFTPTVILAVMLLIYLIPLFLRYEKLPNGEFRKSRKGKNLISWTAEAAKDRDSLLYGMNKGLIMFEILNSNKRCKDLPERWFKKPEHVNDPDRFAVGTLCVDRYMDFHQFKEALEYGEWLLENAGEAVTDQLKAVLKAELLFLEIILYKRREKIDAYFPDVADYIGKYPQCLSSHRVKYAYGRFINDSVTAKQARDEFEKMLPDYKFRAIAEAEQEIMDIFDRECPLPKPITIGG